MDLVEIKQRMEAGADPNDIRTDLGEKMMERLVARRQELSTWERVHFGFAIDLMPTPWLQLTLAHVDSACSGTDRIQDHRIGGEVESAPTFDELIKKLAFVRNEIRAHKLRAKQALRRPLKISRPSPAFR